MNYFIAMAQLKNKNESIMAKLFTMHCEKKERKTAHPRAKTM